PILAVLSLLAIPAAVSAAPQPSSSSIPDAKVKIKVGKLDKGRAEIFSSVPIFGTIAPFVAGQKVQVDFFLDGKPLVSKKVKVTRGGGNFGTFKSNVTVREDGRYTVSATHEATEEQGGDSTVRKLWKVSYPSLSQGECGKAVVGFK